MNAAYANDTLLTYLYLPKRGTKPYPVAVFWPGSNVVRDSLRDPGPNDQLHPDQRPRRDAAGIQGDPPAERCPAER